MAFQTRCPECNAKLKFDEAPEAEEAIECPRCGHVFDAADAKPIKVKKKALAGGGGEDEEPRRKKKKKKPGIKGKAPDGTPKKRRSKKKKANLFVLWVMLGVTLFLAPFVGWFGWKLFFSAGKIGALMVYMPKECNWMRGCDLQRLLSQPAFKPACDTVLKGPFEECRTEFAKAAGVSEPEKFFDYAMCGKSKYNGDKSTIYIFNTLKPFDSGAMFKALGGTEQVIDGQTVQKISKAGILAGAYVYCPAERVIVVIPNEGDQMKMLKGSIAAKAAPKEASILAVYGSTGKKATRAHIWYLMRPEGELKGRLTEDISEPLKQSLSVVSQRVDSTKVFAVWLSLGSSINYGLGMECDSAETASSFATTMQEGPLGKGDDSEIPRPLVTIFPVARSKEFVGEFMSDLKFKSKGTCAYLESKMSYDKSTVVISYFNKPTMFENIRQ